MDNIVIADPDRRPVIAVQRVVVGDDRIQVVVAAGQLQNNHAWVICCHSVLLPISSLSMSGELVFAGGDDQLQHLPDMLVGDLRFAVVPGNLAPFIGLRQQLFFGVGADLDRAQQV